MRPLAHHSVDTIQIVEVPRPSVMGVEPNRFPCPKEVDIPIISVSNLLMEVRKC